MDTVTDPRLTIGGNAPPDPIEELRARLSETHAPLAERRDTIVDMEARIPSDLDAESAGKVADAIKVCAAFTKNSESARVSAKEPHLAAERAVDGFFKALSDPVDALKTRLNAKLTAYQRKVADEERRRREAEAAAERERQRQAEAERREAERLRREAAEAERRAQESANAAERARAAELRREADDAARKARDEANAQREAADKAKREAEAKPADLSRTRTDLGSVASLRRTWAHEVVDQDAVPRMFLTVDHAAIKAFIKARTDKRTGECSARIDGVRIFEQHDSVVR